MWNREVGGVKLTFRLAGINNQNFIMRDDQTGTYWQQISGLAISGPMKGKQLTLVHSDELTFALWKAESPQGTVLNDVAKDVANYAKKDWDVRMKKTPTVIGFAGSGYKDRDLMLGVRAFGASRAFLYDEVLEQKLIKDHVGSEPVLLIAGPDKQSVRVFRDRIPGIETFPDFYRLIDKPDVLMMDEATGSEWNFQGCAVAGPSKGHCLEPVAVVKDYWFDWRNYNPTTTVYRARRSE